MGACGRTVSESENEDKEFLGPYFPRIEIYDVQRGAVVSGTVTNRVVGEYTRLLVRTVPSGLPLTKIAWTVAGERVRSYTQSSTEGKRTELTPADLVEREQIEFFWIDGGAPAVEVDAVVGDRPDTTSAEFDVKRPAWSDFRTTTVPKMKIEQDPNGIGKGWFLIGWKDWLHPGCEFEAKVTAPEGGDGRIAFTQLVHTRREHREVATGERRKKAPGLFLLDDVSGPQYGAAVSVKAGATAELTPPGHSDSPWVSLDGYDEASLRDQFKLYLMYRPNGDDSIWVTLAMSKWHCIGDALYVSTSTLNEWQRGPSELKGSVGESSAELPTWTGRVQELEYK